MKPAQETIRKEKSGVGSQRDSYSSLALPASDLSETASNSGEPVSQFFARKARLSRWWHKNERRRKELFRF
jgi:hypothetical protein